MLALVESSPCPDGLDRVNCAEMLADLSQCVDCRDWSRKMTGLEG